MSYNMRLAFFKEVHTMLERELTHAISRGASDDEIHTLKKKKLHAKDMIAKLTEEGKEFK